MRLDTLLARRFPERFAVAWSEPLAPLRPVRDYKSAELDAIAQRLENWTLQPAGTEGYATAEVTVGGIDTRDLHSKTMERAPCRDSTSSAKPSTSRAGWAATFSMGLGFRHACGQCV